jgi:adenosine deaminase
MREQILKQVASLPKSELHVHLEGSIRPETFLLLAKRNNVSVPVSDLAGVKEYFKFRNFEHFMQLYGETTYLLAKPEDFELITKQLGEDLALSGTRYAEVTFTAGTHYRFKGLPFDEIMGAIEQGAREARQRYSVELRFVIDHVRGFPIDDCFQTAEWCKAAADKGVVAMGLAGYEPDRPASMYAEVWQWLEGEGIAFLPHAGEAAGPEGIWDALQFNPSRIGHGFRAAEDKKLIAELIDRQIVLEICPTSNLCTGVVKDMTLHPFRTLWDAGVPLTLNTDDPTMFNTNMNKEYMIGIEDFGLTENDLASISLRSVKHSLADDQLKARLLSEFTNQIALLGLTPAEA